MARKQNVIASEAKQSHLIFIRLPRSLQSLAMTLAQEFSEKT